MSAPKSGPAALFYGDSSGRLIAFLVGTLTWAFIAAPTMDCSENYYAFTVFLVLLQLVLYDYFSVYAVILSITVHCYFLERGVCPVPYFALYLVHYIGVYLLQLRSLE